MAIVGSASIRITPDLTGFRAQLNRDLKAATAGSKAQVKIDIDTAAARAELATLRREIARLGRERANVRVDVDGGARAQTELAGISREVNKLNGRGINIDTGRSIFQLRGLHAALLALSPAIVQVTSALSPLVGLLGALPGGIVGIGQSVGSLGLAFHGIFGAIREMTQAQDAAAKSALTGSGTIVRAASQVKNAQVALSQANRALANVRRDNAAGAAADARAIKDAIRDLGDAHRDAARQQQDDLRAIADAQQDARRAQLDLNEARRQAIEDLEDLNAASREASMTAREAENSLAQQQASAAATLADPTKSAEEKQQAQIDLALATARVEEAERKEKDAANEAEEARKKGIEGTQGVIAAKQDLADAEDRITEAQDAQAQHRRDSVRAINDAERRLEDARRQRHSNALDRADALKSAEEGVVSAQRALVEANKANTEALTGMSAAAASATVAYDKLSQAGKDFVDAFMRVRETMGDIGDAVADATLPGFTKFLNDVNEVLPDFKDVLVATGDAFGDFAGKVGDLIKGPFGDQLHRIMETNTGVIRDMLGVDSGGGLLGMIEAMGNVADAARPLTKWIGELVDDFGLWAKNVTSGEEGRERLRNFFDKTMDVAKRVGSILGNVFEIIVNIGKAAFPSGSGILGSLDKVTEKFAKWTGSEEGQRKMKKFFDDIKKVFETVGDTISKIVQKMAPLIAKMADFLAKHPNLVKLITTGAVGAAVAGNLPGGGLVGSAVGGLGAGLLRGGGGAAAEGGLLARAAPLVANPVGATVAAGALAVGASYVLSPDAKKIVDSGFKDALDDVSDSFDNLKRSFGEFWDKHGESISKFGNFLAKVIATSFVNGLETFGDALEIVADSFAVLFDALSGDWDAVGKDLEDLFESLMDFQTGNIPGKLASAFLDMFKNAWDGVVEWWHDTVKPWLTALPGRMADWIGQRWDDLKDWIGTKWHNLWAGVKEKFNDLKDWFKSRPSAIARWIGQGWSDLREWLDDKWDGLKQRAFDKLNSMKTFFVNLPGKIYDWIRDAWRSHISDPLARLWDNLVDRIGDIWAKIKSKFASPLNWVIDHVINALIGKVNWVIDVLGGPAHTIPSVNRIEFAGGGVMPGWTPGRDVHHFWSPTGGMLSLSGGEAVMRPEWTQAVGGPQAVEAMNRAAVNRQLPGQRFLSGGVTQGAVSSVRVGDAAAGLGGSGGFPNPLSLLAPVFNTIRNNIAENAPGGPVGQRLAAYTFGTIKDHAYDFVKDRASDFWGWVSAPARAEFRAVRSLASAATPWQGWLPGFADGGVVDPFSGINSAGNRMSGDDSAERRLDQLIAAIAAQPRAVFGAQTVNVDTEADFQRLQQLADWRERGTRVA